jgi:hypothetical protein
VLDSIGCGAKSLHRHPFCDEQCGEFTTRDLVVVDHDHEALRALQREWRVVHGVCRRLGDAIET